MLCDNSEFVKLKLHFGKTNQKLEQLKVKGQIVGRGSQNFEANNDIGKMKDIRNTFKCIILLLGFWYVQISVHDPISNRSQRTLHMPKIILDHVITDIS